MDFKEFILAHDGDDVASLALKRKSLETAVEDWNLALSTIEVRSKLRHKVPQWYAVPSLHYPKALSAEQCSSSETANYKASLVSSWSDALKTFRASPLFPPINGPLPLMSRGRHSFPGTTPTADMKIADLTGGMGVDAWAFSKVAKEVLYNEMDEGLCRAAEHNFRELGVGNVVIENRIVEPGKVKEVLRGFEPDIVFLDPARRGGGGRKVFRLEDCSPNVIELLPELYDACPNIMLKLSPMADITLVCKQLPGVREVHIVATGGECKELLLLLEKGFTGAYSTVVYESGATLVYGDGSNVHKPSTASTPPKQVWAPPSYVAEGGYRFVDITTISSTSYLFEPGKALLKAGAFDMPCEYGLSKLGRHTHLYVSHEPVPEEIAPFGKCFEIVETLPLSGKTMKDVGKRYPKADVTARNIPMTSEELAKRLGVKPGDGTLHIFGTQSDSDGRILIICRGGKWLIINKLAYYPRAKKPGSIYIIR
ncbi:MAG: hypothetical protein IKR38_03115 [Bacteroidales bacterium]|nr:hypothetical protein [Bacteroidales bacterium]